MTTEYYQIPSQQGLLPLESSSPDPWLASATSSFSSLSLSADWSVKPQTTQAPPSLFDAGDVEALTWNTVVPMHTAGAKEVKAPKVPKQFNSTTSKIDAWSVVDNVVANKPSTAKRNSVTSLSSSTSSVTDDKPIEDELTAQNRYKTELCKSFTETGICRYGSKCQFAHGKEEVRPILRHPKYKTEICKTFHTTGTCPYGIRCRFIHTRSKENESPKLSAVKKVPAIPVDLEEGDEDEIVSLNPPPGIPVPQWSKSWNMSIASSPRKSIQVSSDRLVEPEPAF